MSQDHGQPIAEWAEEQEALTKGDRLALLTLIHVRTVGDLEVALSRGEVEKALAAKIKKALEN